MPRPDLAQPGRRWNVPEQSLPDCPMPHLDLAQPICRWNVPDQSLVPLLALPRDLLQAVTPLLTAVSTESQGGHEVPV